MQSNEYSQIVKTLFATGLYEKTYYQHVKSILKET